MLLLPTSPIGNTPPVLAGLGDSLEPAATGLLSVGLSPLSRAPCVPTAFPCGSLPSWCQCAGTGRCTLTLALPSGKAGTLGFQGDNLRQEQCPDGVTLEFLACVPVPGGTLIKLSWCSGCIALAVVSSSGGGSGGDGGSSDDAACSHTALQQLAPALLGKPVPGALAVPSSGRGTTALLPP